MSAASVMKAGIKNRFCGNIFSREIRNAFSDALRYTSPLQNPMAKLLNHKTSRGTGHNRCESMAAIIRAMRGKLERSDDKNARKNPPDGDAIPDSSSVDR